MCTSSHSHRPGGRALAVALAAFALIVAGAGAPAGPATDACETSAEWPGCPLAAGTEVLHAMQDGADKVTAGAELALAYLAVGDVETARSLLADANARALAIDDAATRTQALTEIADAAADAGLATGEQALLAVWHAVQIADPAKRADRLGRIAVLMARLGFGTDARRVAAALPTGDGTLGAYQARTLQGIAEQFAANGQLEQAAATLASATAGLIYYRAVGYAQIGRHAILAGRPDLGEAWLDQAVRSADEQTEGYFVAGALRRIAAEYAAIGDMNTATRFFGRAVDGARAASTQQQRARALSRIATTLADLGLHERAVACVNEAIAVAGADSDRAIAAWVAYEIAGAAAFAGDGDTAYAVLETIPADVEFAGRPVRAAAQRDVAWGLARHGDRRASLRLIGDIANARERVQALARLVRLHAQPDMPAYSRYL
ncbi:MAG: hypothetical protein AAFX58_04130 [Pseudomonadota bacterium]